MAILGFITFATLKEMRGDETLDASQRKMVNLFADSLRVVFYSLILVFMKPFVF